jgi:hypothetical protein
MYVRLWKHDGSVSDRPIALYLDVDGDDGLYVEWPNDPDDRGSIIVSAVQRLSNQGVERSAREVLDPPWALYCECRSGPPETWTYRLPGTLLGFRLPQRGA